MSSESGSLKNRPRGQLFSGFLACQATQERGRNRIWPAGFADSLVEGPGLPHWWGLRFVSQPIVRQPELNPLLLGVLDTARRGIPFLDVVLAKQQPQIGRVSWWQTFYWQTQGAKPPPQRVDATACLTPELKALITLVRVLPGESSNCTVF